ncbi:hypothetical protein P6709_10780 [Jeotgalibacillus sp. ET6]|uniref:hypothetical protein n=1 Tax=Jeotgalibacillus sp. ET6 TaxID=3037260 RepID=UPI0024188DCE|nr:hypothetical protein [Jeotgalibacillus sp. ET6]MDG5472238.1 hypothetical protein [Jeotgalibacillus sp. ET6]
MNLFASKNAPQVVFNRMTWIETPLGTVYFEAGMADSSQTTRDAPMTTYQFTSGVMVHSFKQPGFEAELLLCEVPVPYQVDKVMAGIWRLKAHEDGRTFRFKTGLVPNPSLHIHTGPGGGEHFEALTMHDDKWHLSLGTEDEEKLLYRESVQDFLPLSLHDRSFKPPFQSYGLVGMEKDLCFDVELPAIRKQEIAQIHFAVSWKRLEDVWNDISTWVSVDLNAKVVLKQIELN